MEDSYLMMAHIEPEVRRAHTEILSTYRSSVLSEIRDLKVGDFYHISTGTYYEKPMQNQLNMVHRARTVVWSVSCDPTLTDLESFVNYSLGLRHGNFN